MVRRMEWAPCPARSRPSSATPCSKILAYLLLSGFDHLDERRQRGRGQLAAGVVQVEARNRRAPVIQHADQRAVGQGRAGVGLVHVGETHTGQRRLQHEWHFAHRQAAFHVHRHLFARFFKLPGIACTAGKPDAHAGPGEEVTGRVRCAHALEQGGRAHHHQALGRPQGQGHHVLLQALAIAHTGIEARLHDVHKTIVQHQLHLGLGVTSQKLGHQRAQHQLTRWAGRVDAQQALRRVAELVDAVDGRGNVLQRRAHAVQQLPPCGRERHAARGAAEHAHAQSLFDGTHGMAHGRGGQVQLLRGHAKAQVSGHGAEQLEISQVEVH